MVSDKVGGCRRRGVGLLQAPLASSKSAVRRTASAANREARATRTKKQRAYLLQAGDIGENKAKGSADAIARPTVVGRALVLVEGGKRRKKNTCIEYGEKLHFVFFSHFPYVTPSCSSSLSSFSVIVADKDIDQVEQDAKNRKKRGKKIQLLTSGVSQLYTRFRLTAVHFPNFPVFKKKKRNGKKKRRKKEKPARDVSHSTRSTNRQRPFFCPSNFVVS